MFFFCAGLDSAHVRCRQFSGIQCSLTYFISVFTVLIILIIAGLWIGIQDSLKPGPNLGQDPDPSLFDLNKKKRNVMFLKNLILWIK